MYASEIEATLEMVYLCTSYSKGKTEEKKKKQNKTKIEMIKTTTKKGQKGDNRKGTKVHEVNDKEKKKKNEYETRKRKMRNETPF